MSIPYFINFCPVILNMSRMSLVKKSDEVRLGNVTEVMSRHRKSLIMALLSSHLMTLS